MYMARAAESLKEADRTLLPQRRQQALIAAERWQQLAKRAQRVAERVAAPAGQPS
jgi:hypothetical protein